MLETVLKGGRSRVLYAQQILYYKSIESSIKNRLEMSEFPTPLHILLESYHNEKQAFKKVHRLIDTFEWAIKWHTVLVMSDLFGQQYNYNDDLKVLLSAGLYTPSLGVWVFFFREILKYENLPSPQQPWKEWEKLTEVNKTHDIVRFRNSYAHGATPSDEKCREDCEQWFPILKKLIDSPFFKDIQMIVAEETGIFRWVGCQRMACFASLENGRVGVVHRDDPDRLLLDLWPLGLLGKNVNNTQQKPLFFYFNAIRNKRLEKLNYEFSLMLRDKELWSSFVEFIPLDEWKKIKNPDLDFFRERIELLTSVFKGRIVERKHVHSFCQQSAGSMMIWGAPGIGKSALLAQTFKEIRSGLDLDGHSLKGSYPHIVIYFIRRGEETVLPERFLRHLCHEFDRCYKLKGFGLGNTTFDLRESLYARLNRISQDAPSRKMVLFIDGLDEALYNGNTILQYIPNTRSWLSIIVSARSIPKIHNWFQKWKSSRTEELYISPISSSDIRAMLYEVVNKYSDQLTDKYIEVITQKSQGNPLYVKLLCEELFQGTQQLGNIEDLPKDLKNLYVDVIKRITENGNRQELYDLFLLLTESKSALSCNFISDFFEINMMQANHRVECMLELLSKKEGEGESSYLFFHESLREHIRDMDAHACILMKKKLADYTFDWISLKFSSLRYALSFASIHLWEQDDGERLWSLVNDEEYQKQQIKVSKQYTDSFKLFQKALEWYVAKQGQPSEMDVRLAQIVMKSGILAQQAKQNVREAISWFEENTDNLETTLQRIKILDEPQFFNACVLLMWIEADRQLLWKEDERNLEIPEKILQCIEERIPEGIGTVNWSEYLHINFVVYWVHKMYSTWSKLDLGVFYRRGLKLDELIEYILRYGYEIYIWDMFLVLEEIDYASGARHGEPPHEKDSEEILTLIEESILEEMEKGDFEYSLEILENIESKIEDDDLKSQIFSKIAVSLYYNGDIDRSLEIAFNIQDKNQQSKVFRHIAWSMAEKGDIDRSLEIISHMDQSKQFIGFSLVILSIAKNGDIERSLTIINNFEGRGKKLLLLTSIAEYIVESGDIERSLEIVKEINGNNYRKYRILDMIIKYLVNNDNIKRSLEIATEIDGDNHTKYRVFGMIIKYLAEKGDIEHALKLIKEIKDDKDKSQAITIVVKYLAKIGDVDRSLELMKKIKCDESKSQILSVIVEHLAKKGDIEHSLELITKIKYDKHKSQALSIISEYLAKRGNIEHSLEIAKQLKETNRRKKVFSTIVECTVGLGEVEWALKIILEVDHHQTKVSSLNTFTKYLIKTRDIKCSLPLIFEMEDNQLKYHILSLISVHFAENGDADYSLNLVSKMEGKYKSKTINLIASNIIKTGKIASLLNLLFDLEDDEYKFQTISLIAIERCKNGEIEHSLEMINYLKNQTRSYTLSVIAEILIQNRDVRYSRKVFYQTIELIEEVKYGEKRYEVFNLIAEYIAKNGNIEYVLEILPNLKSKDGHKVRSIMAEYLAKNGEAERSLEMISGLKGKEKSQTLSTIAEYLAKSGEIKRALESVSNLKDKEKFEIFNSISNHIVKTDKIEYSLEIIPDCMTLEIPIKHEDESGEAKRALEIISGRTIEEIKEIAESVAKSGNIEYALEIILALENNRYYIDILGLFAKKFEKKGNYRVAQDIFTQILKITSTFDEEYKFCVFDVAIDHLIKNGNIKYTLEIISTLEDDMYKLDILGLIAKKFEKKGNYQVAQDIFTEILKITSTFDEDYKLYAFDVVIEHLIMCGNLKSLIELIELIEELIEDITKAGLINDLSKKISQYEKKENNFHLYRNFINDYLLTSDKSNMFYISFLNEYQNSLVSLFDFRSTLLYFPFNLKSTYDSLYHFITMLYEADQIQTAHNIIRNIPELELELFLPSIFDLSLSFNNLNTWISNILDQDDRKQVELWSKRVKKGTETSEWFDQQIKTLSLQLSTKRTYNNLDTWIDKVSDEDDKDQIQLWIRRVEKGQKTPEWFNQQIKNIEF